LQEILRSTLRGVGHPEKPFSTDAEVDHPATLYGGADLLFFAKTGINFLTKVNTRDPACPLVPCPPRSTWQEAWPAFP